jgi:signal transduction histidine kinase
VRDGEEQWVEVPVREVPRRARLARVAASALVAGVLLMIPLFLLWNSASRAVLPIGILYSATAVVVVTLISGRHSGCDWLTRASLLAMISVPAALAHLSLTFPRERKVIRDAPSLLAVPYLLSGFLLPAGWLALERNALLWPTFMYLLVALSAGGWMILVVSCAYAIRESASAIERARARVLCFGVPLLPLIPTLWVAQGDEGFSEIITAYVWISPVVMPLPIGLAISRYNLFNLEWDVRRWVGRFLYLATAALVITLVLEASFAMAGTSHPLRDPALMFLVSFACVAAIEPVRGRMLGFIESMLSPRLKRLRALREGYEREMARLHDEEAVARRLGSVLHRGVAPTSGCVFLAAGEDWQPAYPFGVDPPTRTSLVRAALSLLGDRGLLQLVSGSETEASSRRSLVTEGVEVVAVVESGAERFGLVLLKSTESRIPYTDMELDFVAMAASHAGIALRNARLSQELVSAERSATTGRVAVTLAHDLGKELDWMSRLVRRLPKRVDDRERLLRDIGMIQEFTESLMNGLQRFVGDATESIAEPPGISRFEDLIENALSKMARIHGPDRVTQSIDPAIRRLRCHESLGRVVANLLDNALHATAKAETVHLFATREDGWIRVVVLDRGPGIPEGARDQVFDPGFSTRSDQGGLGVGLTVSREIVEELGGTIELTPNDDWGTRATVRVPDRCRS